MRNLRCTSAYGVRYASSSPGADRSSASDQLRRASACISAPAASSVAPAPAVCASPKPRANLYSVCRTNSSSGVLRSSVSVSHAGLHLQGIPHQLQNEVHRYSARPAALRRGLQCLPHHHWTSSETAIHRSSASISGKIRILVRR